MTRTLHITNGDIAAGLISEAGIPGDVLPWRDVLHDGPVPAGLTLEQLSLVRSQYLASCGAGPLEALERSFAERNRALRAFGEYDEVVLWFEWDLYDQLQLIQLLDFFSRESSWDDAAEGAPRLSLICVAGYLGSQSLSALRRIFADRKGVAATLLRLGSEAWSAFTAADPLQVEGLTSAEIAGLPFLADALLRHLQDLPSVRNGLSRSESQILELLSPEPLSFSELFRRASAREERTFCGDFTMAVQIASMSAEPAQLVSAVSGEMIVASMLLSDPSRFADMTIARTPAGQALLADEDDWVALGGARRWHGGVDLVSSVDDWRWDNDSGVVRSFPKPQIS